MLEVMAAAAMLLQQGQATACVAAPAKGHTGAANLAWVTGYEPLTFGKKTYTKYGLPRVLGPTEVELVGSYKGGFLYAETGNPARDVLYLLTNLAGCEFQPYQIDQ